MPPTSIARQLSPMRTSGMDSHSPSKRRRIITTCWECHRRKQKCNRARPCNGCVARNVPEKCSYSNLAAMGEAKVPQEQHTYLFTKRKRRGQEDINPLSTPLNLPDQVGYSSMGGSNAFIGLQKSLQDSNELVAANITTFGSSLEPCAKDEFHNLVTQLPPHSIAVELVEVFFSEANWYFLVLERYYFNKLHNSWLVMGNTGSNQDDVQNISRDLQYFPALLFQVVAVALQFLPPHTASARALHLEDSSACDHLSQEYSKMGMDIMALLGRHNSTLTAVQHDLMRALWLKNCSRGTESWYSLGNAIRQAQDLGLHLQCSVRQAAGGDVGDTLIRLWYDEYKRRLWVTLFTWDSHMALILGRPRTINVNDCTIITPIDCDIPEDPSKSVPAAMTGHDVPSSYSSHLFHYALGHKVHEMLSLGAGKRNWKDYHAVKALHGQVIALLDALPPVVRPENPDVSWDSKFPYLPKKRQHILSAASSFLMALHRPHVSVHVESRQAAIQAALDCLESQQRLFELVSRHHFKIYTLSFYTIDAGIFLSAITIEYPSLDHHLLDRIHRALRQAITRLTLMQERSPMAESGAKILTTCYQKMQDSSRANGRYLNQYDSTDQPSQLSRMQHIHDFLECDHIHGLHDPTDSFLPSINEWGWTAPSQLDESTSSGILSNVIESNTSFWMDQMGPNLDLDPGAPINESTWSSLLG